MNLTPQDKVKIFQEEWDARQEEAEVNKKRRIEMLTQEEREQIFNELNEVPAVFMDEKDITKPHKGSNIMEKIISGIIGISFFIFSFKIAIIIVVVGIIIICNMGSCFYKLRYSCPACDHQREYSIHAEKDQKDLQELGYIRAKCPKCSQEFNLYCESLYGVTTWNLKD